MALLLPVRPRRHPEPRPGPGTTVSTGRKWILHLYCGRGGSDVASLLPYFTFPIPIVLIIRKNDTH